MKQQDNFYLSNINAIIEYLSQSQLHNGTFPARTFYGISFSILLWNNFPSKYKINIQRAIKYCNIMDKSKSNFHWEFNNYALLKYYLISNDLKIKQYIENMKYNGTKVVNWTLLRSLDRLYRGKSLDKIKAYIELLIVFSLNRQGFFKDDWKVNSFQYHCFSTAIIGELFLITKNKIFLKNFLKGVHFIFPFILKNGDTLYIGRGQEQIFGYGCLLFILELAYALTKNSQLLKKIDNVKNFIKKFQRKDGSFPLVLRIGEKGYPKIINCEDPKFLGWYSHNNYFDYLPFFCYYLLLAYRISKFRNKFKEKIYFRNKLKNVHFSKDFMKITRGIYEAVISRGGGQYSNDLPIPYINFENNSISPCYGGEQFFKSLYKIETIPLPYAELDGKTVYFRNLRFKLKGNNLIGNSSLIHFKRSFDFKRECILIRDKIVFKKDLYFIKFIPINLFFFNVKKISLCYFQCEYNDTIFWIRTSNPCEIYKNKYYSARGKLISIREMIHNLKVSKNQIFRREIEINFSSE